MPACKYPMADQKKPDNRKTAWMLGVIALLFFIAVFVKRMWFS
jgi:hypothetical protein